MTVDEASKSGRTADPPGPVVPEQDFAALAPGKTVGRYEIVSILGQGGFGITYRARDAQLHREVAIKEYLPSALAVRPDGITVLPRSTKVAEDFGWGRQRFVDEGRTLATLQRAPAIVRVFDFLEANGTAYIVMELVPGDTLEHRLRRGRLSAAEIDRILWPLLDGLEQVHDTGFLHRDIKPANILLDAQGTPTLIDFGASRAAIAGRTAAMTAIFTPGYAAAEQMTSAKQGPWTDIYGISATLYHAITGTAPPSSFDRMLDDEYRPLGQLLPAGFAPGLLVGIDAGLAVRASDRPQSIAGWRPVLGQIRGRIGVPDAQATVALGRAAVSGATVAVRRPTLSSTSTPATATAPEAAPPPARRGIGLWVGLAAMVLALAGGGYWYATNKASTEQAAVAAKERAGREQAAKAQAAKAAENEAELRRLRDDKAKADQAAHDEEVKRLAEEDFHRKQAADQAAKEKADADAKATAAAEQAAKEKAEAADRQHAEAAETALHFAVLDRQRIQVALTALGFNTNGTDGIFGQHTRDMVAAWQTKRADPPTGYLTGAQQQALLRDAGPAISKFDDDQKKADEAKAKAAQPAPAQSAPAQSAVGPAVAVAPPGATSPADGHWRGTYQCSGNRGAGPFTILLDVTLSGGSGTWHRRGSGPGTKGNQSITVLVTGIKAVLERLYFPTAGNNVGTLHSASLGARFEGGTITGSGPEMGSGGRSCSVILTR